MANHGRSHWQSRLRNLLAGPLGLCLVLCALVSCGDQNTTMMQVEGPLVRIRVSPVDPGAIKAVLTVSAPDPAGLQVDRTNTFNTAPFDLLGVSFPIGTRVQATFKVELFGPNDCLLATGTAIANIDSDGVLDISLNVTPVPLCGNGAVLTVQVANIGAGVGTVTSSPNGISCDGLGNGCTVTVMKGKQFTLTANPMAGTFTGWSGGGCTGMAPCMVTINQDTVVQAAFSTCRGWCKEMLPASSVTSNLLGVGGTAPSNVMVVGESGAAFVWDGAIWKTVQLPPAAATKTLRAAAGKPAATVTYVAGDGGTILKWSSGGFTQVTNPSTANLRAIAIGNNTSPNTFFVGDGGTSLILSSGGSLVTGSLMAGTANLLSICQLPGKTTYDLFIGGAPPSGGATRGFAAEWDGAGKTTVQMAMGGSIMGNVNAMLCGSTAFHYAAGDGGVMLQRAVSATGKGSENSWTTVMNTGAGTNGIRAMWSSGDTFVIAVGDGGMILQWDGATWKPMTSGVTNTLRAVFGTSPTNVYAVGDGGTVLHYSP